MNDHNTKTRTRTPPRRETDVSLVARAQQGDRRAFETLVERHQRRLARVIARIIRDPAEVEDAVQDSLVKAWRALPAFRGNSAFYTWLYRIGVNTAKNHLLAMSRRLPTSGDIKLDEEEALEIDPLAPDMDTPDRVLEAKQAAARVDRSIARLPRELRVAIELREEEMLAYEDIARRMKCPIGTVRSRIFRARESVAADLERLG